MYFKPFHCDFPQHLKMFQILNDLYIAGFLVDAYGRRLAIMVNALIFVLGAVLLAATPTFTGLVSPPNIVVSMIIKAKRLV